ncbi:phenylalanine--tRNA ligase subunit beta, partial [bacterium]|nr:phenylalanine--tRNA ligase subunit beta [bacterium]
MKTTYRWLTEVLGFEIPPQEMVDKLIMIGHEVENTIDLGMLENPIRIARVVKVAPHPAALEPNAKPNVLNMTVCEVDDGHGESCKVVCGAPNVREGQISVLARSGAILPNGLALKTTKVRGVPSEGMLVAPDELGLGSDHSGIIVLEDDALVGQGYDLILEMEITPNRPDCLSVIGLARDLAAAHHRKVYFHPPRVKETYENVQGFGCVTVKCADDCPRYTARIIQGVRIGPSPDWLKRRLLAVGLRPINNVVDVTNYVLMELGHPLHAFDYDKLSNHEIIVRHAEPGEQLRLIDESIIELAPGEDMVIADGQRPVALAGIMGGRDSEVSEKTENILLESAYFNPSTIRRSARRHKMSTDASYRFERGADPEGLIRALDRAASLIVEVAGGKVPKGILGTQPKKTPVATIVFRPERACRVLGIDLSKTEVADLAAAMGCEVIRSEDQVLVLSVPSYRIDITREEDIYEEVARLYGFDRIPATMPYKPIAAEPGHPAYRLRRLLQDLMVDLGFQEAIHISFISEAQLQELDCETGSVLRVSNPISRDQEILRPDLTPSMLRTLVRNQNRGNADLHLFEISKTFHFGDMATPYEERQKLMLACMGACHPRSWQDGGAPADFFHLKGILEILFAKLGIPEIRLEKGGPSFLHPGRCARILLDGPEGDVKVGWVGELGPKARARLDLRGRPVLAEIDVLSLGKCFDPSRRFQEIPRYPAIERDLALVVDQDVPAGRIAATIRSVAGNLLESLDLFDHYTGEQVGSNKKSLAYHAIYRDPQRTLQDEEVDRLQKKILKELVEKAG